MGLSVQANGAALPVFYASENQVNFRCPDSPVGASVSLIIQSETGASAPLAATTQFATPGIYSLNGNGRGQGAVLVSGTANVAMIPTKGVPSQPAPQGSSISIYASGLGATSIPVAAGAAAPSDPLAEVTAPVDVLINGEKAEVTSAILHAWIQRFVPGDCPGASVHPDWQRHNGAACRAWRERSCRHEQRGDDRNWPGGQLKDSVARGLCVLAILVVSDRSRGRRFTVGRWALAARHDVPALRASPTAKPIPLNSQQRPLDVMACVVLALSCFTC